MNNSAFVRRIKKGVPYYSCRIFEEHTWTRHGFSTRHGGVSADPPSLLNLTKTTWDAAENVTINRRRFLEALDLADVPLVTLSQNHSDRLHIIGEKFDQRNRRPEGDALASRLTMTALGVQIADCFPILLLDPQNRAVAAVHSGWKGTLSRLLFKTVRAMHEAFNTEPSRLLVALGPGIRSCCFEVGPEVAGPFAREYARAGACRHDAMRQNKLFVDLPHALLAQLREAGVSPENAFDMEACTRCRQDEFFSYRGEGSRSGRMMAVIALL